MGTVIDLKLARFAWDSWPKHLRHAIPRMAAYYEREFVLAGAPLHVSVICAQAQQVGFPPRAVSINVPHAQKILGLRGPVTEYDLAMAALHHMLLAHELITGVTKPERVLIDLAGRCWQKIESGEEKGRLHDIEDQPAGGIRGSIAALEKAREANCLELEKCRGAKTREALACRDVELQQAINELEDSEEV